MIAITLQPLLLILIYIYKKLLQQAVLAQLVERTAFNRVVVGSIPTDGDYIFIDIFLLVIFVSHSSWPKLAR